jgi:hypothetical protein
VYLRCGGANLGGKPELSAVVPEIWNFFNGIPMLGMEQNKNQSSMRLLGGPVKIVVISFLQSGCRGPQCHGDYSNLLGGVVHRSHDI